jgi:GntR family transcriptional repressor for pyruvate dehydrogenase complex
MISDIILPDIEMVLAKECSMWTEPVSNLSRVEAVTHRIRQLIESGKLVSGDQIPSGPELADQLKVSHTVLREAISALQSVGILEVRRGVGTFVSTRDGLAASTRLLHSAVTISAHDLRTAFEFRRGIEQQAARLAALKVTPEDADILSKLCIEMDQHDYKSIESLRADFRFHQKVVDMTGNSLMRHVMTVLYEFILAANYHMSLASTDTSRGYAHVPIAEAIRSGNPDAAEAVMREHMDLIERQLKNVSLNGSAQESRQPAGKQ